MKKKKITKKKIKAKKQINEYITIKNNLKR